MQLPSYDTVQAQISALSLSLSASELHGLMCGWVAGAGAQSGNWLAALMADETLPAPAPDSPLAQLFAATCQQFEQRDFGLALLLEEEDKSLAVRSGSLFDFCRGLLAGIGLALGQEDVLGEEAKEALADLGRLAVAEPQHDGDEDDEAALVELEEFVRIVVLLLHSDVGQAMQRRRNFH